MALEIDNEGEVEALKFIVTNGSEGTPLNQTIFVTSDGDPNYWKTSSGAYVPGPDAVDLDSHMYRPLEDSRKDLAAKLAQSVLDDLAADYEERGNDHAIGVPNYWWADDNPLPENLRPSYAMWMCKQVIANKNTWGSTRMHRWIGYIQAILILSGVTGLEWEKDRVRDLKKLYRED